MIHRFPSRHTLLAVLRRPELWLLLVVPALIGCPDSPEKIAAEASLHTAAKQGDLARITQLVDSGADVDAKDKRGLTPLIKAVSAGNIGAAELLIARGADVNFRDNPPLHWAISSGEVKTVELLLDKGADINARNSWGAVPLHAAAGWSPGKGQADSSCQMAQLLIARGAEVNVRHTWGATPLHAAARKGNPGLVEVLLANGAEVNPRDDKGRTPLFRSGRSDVAALLIAAGADVNAANNEGVTPLDAARQKKDGAAIADLLVAAGARE
jgi:ankyrin repeat protein